MEKGANVLVGEEGSEPEEAKKLTDASSKETEREHEGLRSITLSDKRWAALQL